MPPLESTLRTADGLSLAAEHHLRPGCRAVVAIVHGYAEHMGRYSELLAALGTAGYECHLLDLRGHGRSEGVRGHVLRFHDYLDDLEIFLSHIDKVRAPEPGRTATPRILIGHSLGGLISLQYVLRRPDAFAALAVSSPFLRPRMKLPRLKVGLASIASRLTPALLMQSDLQTRWLSHDPAVVAAYEADPLVFKTVNPRWFFEVRRAQQEVFEHAGEIRLPALVLLGSADPIADPETSRRVYERLGSADKHLEVYAGFLHEILNEVERARVVRDLLAWLDARTARMTTPSAPAGSPPAR